MAAPVEPWWTAAQEAAQRLASTIDAAASRASRDGVYEPPPGVAAPRRRRRPGSLRHLAEVIRTHRFAPGLSVDKDIVARVLDGDLRYITDPTAVVAVARASCLIAGVAFGDDDARRLTVACDYVASLVRAAQDADRRAPDLVPAVRPTTALRPARTGSTPAPPRRRTRPLTILVGLVLVVIVAAVGAVVSASGSGLPPLAARPGGDPRGPGAADPAVNPNCVKDAPPAGTDLLDVPHRHPDDATNRKMNDWWANDDRIEMASYGLRNFEATVHTGQTNIWDLVIVRSCLPLVAGRRYRLTLTASATMPATVRVRVQEPEGVVLSFSTDMRLGPRPRRLDVPLVADASTRQGELMFQVGGSTTDYRLRVGDIGLMS